MKSKIKQPKNKPPSLVKVSSYESDYYDEEDDDYSDNNNVLDQIHKENLQYENNMKELRIVESKNDTIIICFFLVMTVISLLIASR